MIAERVGTAPDASRHAPYETNAWLVILAFAAGVVAFAWNPTPIAEGLAAILIAGALLHAVLNYGLRDALAFFVICVAISFGVENIGATWGVPFGRYHFEVGADLPHVGAIPIIVGPLWFGMGYFSWIVAGTLLDGAERRPGTGRGFLALPVVAAFVMTQWDLVMDPPLSTLSKAWIWHDGGADFGVPLSNYLGWLLTSWLFYQAFALYLLICRADPHASEPSSRAFRWAPIFFYVSSGLTHLTPWLLGQTGEVSDAGGRIWRVEALREATVAVMLFTMVFTSLLAALRLAESASPSSR